MASYSISVRLNLTPHSGWSPDSRIVINQVSKDASPARMSLEKQVMSHCEFFLHFVSKSAVHSCCV